MKKLSRNWLLSASFLFVLLAGSAAVLWPSRYNLPVESKIGAVHYFQGYRNSVKLDPQPLKDHNIRQVVLVPYAYQKSHLNADLQIGDQRRQQRRDSMFRQQAMAFQSEGIEVIFKPHIWMGTEDGKWRSDIDFTLDSVASAWGERYRTFILKYAKMSEEVGAPLFCIGTELTLLSKSHPSYWRSLIAEVRQLYSGKLFYAANWYEELESITFWDDLDYIGVQAYYPLTDLEEPSLKQLIKSWQPIKRKLKKLSTEYQRPVLFSEMGYRSTSCAAIHPWEWVHHNDEDQTFKLSVETQETCYEAVFRSFWHEPWFAGLMVWQWRGDHINTGGPSNLNFTPQNKPAEKVLSHWFYTE